MKPDTDPIAKRPNQQVTLNLLGKPFFRNITSEEFEALCTYCEYSHDIFFYFILSGTYDTNSMRFEDYE